MASTHYVVWVAPELRRSLDQRFPRAPLKEILRAVLAALRTSPQAGRRAPMPHGPTVLIQVLSVATAEGTFRVTPYYEIVERDRAVDLFEIGIVRQEEE